MLMKEGNLTLFLPQIPEPLDTVCSCLSSAGEVLMPPPKQIFLHFSVIVMSIAATRMYRSLADSVFGSAEVLPFASSLAFTTVQVDDSIAHPTAFKRTNAEF